MKHLFTLAGLLLFVSLHAQLIEEDTTSNEPFFKATKFHSSGYVQAEVHGGQILKNKGVGLTGLSLSWAINHRYVLTAQYFTIASRNNVSTLVEPNISNAYLIHHYAGAGFSYIFFHDKKVSLQPGFTAGWCTAKYRIAGDKFRKRDYAAVVPSVSAVFNASKHFRVGVGVNYRAAFGPQFFALKANDLSGVGGVVFFRVGTF